MLALLGAAHAFLVWSGDVLLLYATLAVPFSLLFVHRRPKTLVVWAVGILGALTLLGRAPGVLALLPSPAEGAAAPVEASTHQELAQGAEEAYGGGSYPDQVRQCVREYFFANLPLAFLASGTQVFSMLLLGVAVANAGRVGDRSGLRPRVLRAAVLGLAVGVPSNLLYAASFEVGPQGAPWYLYLTETAWYVGAPSMALGWMGLVVLIFLRAPALRGSPPSAGWP